jgi:hypothetical protein
MTGLPDVLGAMLAGFGVLAWGWDLMAAVSLLIFFAFLGSFGLRYPGLLPVALPRRFPLASAALLGAAVARVLMFLLSFRM